MIEIIRTENTDLCEEESSCWQGGYRVLTEYYRCPPPHTHCPPPHHPISHHQQSTSVTHVINEFTNWTDWRVSIRFVLSVYREPTWSGKHINEFAISMLRGSTVWTCHPEVSAWRDTSCSWWQQHEQTNKYYWFLGPHYPLGKPKPWPGP